MLRAFYTSATGMRAQETLIDNTANNLANVNTTGFKRSQVNFTDLLYVVERPAGAASGGNTTTPVGLEIGSGVRPAATTKVFTAGMPEPTQNPLDVAIRGEGFFQVTLPSGDQRLTRDGSFHTDAQGNLVTAMGYQVDGGINIPPDIPLDQISIAQNGDVSAQRNGQTVTLGRVLLYRVPNPAGLTSLGNNLYGLTPASGQTITGEPGVNGMGEIVQGHLELSNVEVVKELVSLISAQRAYEINARAIRAGDEMLSNTANIIR